MDADRNDEPQRPAPVDAGEGPRERKVWIAVYAVIMLVLAVGTARRVWSMF